MCSDIRGRSYPLSRMQSARLELREDVRDAQHRGEARAVGCRTTRDRAN